MRKKILFLITKSTWGGAQRQIFDLATSLPKDAYDVEVAYGGDGRLADMLQKAGIRTIAIERLSRDISFSKEILAFFSILAIVRKERPDILHVHSSKAGGLGALAGRMCRVPHIVFTAHAWAFNEKRHVLSRAAIALLHWLTVLLAHHTIAVSHAVYGQMARYPFTDKKMSVIHPGVADTVFKSKEAAREFLKTKMPARAQATDAHWVGTIAELHPTKDLPVAIDAVGELVRAGRRVTYVIIGGGEERGHLTKLIEEKGLGASVFLLGHVDDAAALIPAFDLFVLLSRSEALGYVLLEAGLAGCPVLASTVGGIPEVVTDGVSGRLVPPHDAARSAEAIEELLKDERKRERFAHALREDVRERFSFPVFIEKTVRVYERIH